MQPFEFQLQDAEWLARRRRALLSSDLGTGKTVVALLAAQQLARPHPVLIVCKPDLKLKWTQEIQRWWPGQTVHQLGGSRAQHHKAWQAGWATDRPCFLLNYESLRLRLKQLLKPAERWGCIIVDESHLLKNRKAAVSKAAAQLFPQADFLWLLDGNPIPAGVTDLWHQLRLLYPERYRSFWRWADEHCWVTQNQWGWEISKECRNPDRLVEEMAPFNRRRSRVEVFPQMPDLIRSQVPVEQTVSQQQACRQLDDEMLVLIQDQAVPTVTALAQFTRLRQLSIYPELVTGQRPVQPVPKFDYILSVLESNSHPLIIFSSFGQALNRLDEQLARAGHAVVSVRGGPQAGQRVADFQSGQGRVLTATLASIRDGHDLYRAWHCIFLDVPFTWSEAHGAEGRLLRYGQQETVLADYLLTEDSADQLLFELVLERRLAWKAIFERLVAKC